MTTEVAVRERLTGEQLGFIKDTDFVPKAYRGNIAAILAAVATGREYGLGDMESLRLIDVIDGRPELRAEAKVKLARRAGHSITGTVDAEKATVTGKRADTGDTMSVTYTLADAELAGLLSKPNWKKHPKEMLWARAVTILSRRLFGDVVLDIPDAYENESIAEAEEVDALAAVTDLPPVDPAALESGEATAEAGTTAASSGGATTPAASLDDLEAVVVTSGAHEGKTLDQVAALPGGRRWLNWCAKNVEHPQCPEAAAYLEAIS